MYFCYTNKGFRVVTCRTVTIYNLLYIKEIPNFIGFSKVRRNYIDYKNSYLNKNNFQRIKEIDRE
jgi:hypothetical protein